MARKKLSTAEKEALLAEKRRRNPPPPFTIESISKPGPQRDYLISTARFRCLMCTRRAGKTYDLMEDAALTALDKPGVTVLYLGLTEKAVRYSVIPKIWNKLVKKYALPFQPLNSDLVALCDNGSIVRFGSIDDAGHIDTYLGDSMAGGGLVLLDEMQSVRAELAKRLVESVILPMLDDTTDEFPEPGRLTIAGTIPDVPYGYLYKTYVEATEGKNGFEPHRWSRLENPWLTNQDKALQQTAEFLKIPIDDPVILRTFRGHLIFGENTGPYRYNPKRSTYVPTSLRKYDVGPFHCAFAPIQDCDRIIVGIDPAQTRDRFAFTIWGYNSRTKRTLFHLGECITDPGADPLESQWLDVLKEIKKVYNHVSKVIRDPGSSAPVNDMLRHSHGIIVESAIKGPGSLKASVDLLADLLGRGIARVIEGSQLDDDLQTCRWLTSDLEKGKYAFDKTHRSPDVADSARYIVPFFTALGAKAETQQLTSELKWFAEQAKKGLEHIWKDLGPDPKSKPSAKLWKVPS